MLERLVAALLLIGGLLWGASLLATPEDDAPTRPHAHPEGSARLPSADEPALPDEEDEEKADKDPDRDR